MSAIFAPLFVVALLITAVLLFAAWVTGVFIEGELG